jgi:hypothetical protein
MQRKVLAFLVMSGVLMASYLLVIAGPNPPWPVSDDDVKQGSILEAWVNTYVAYNLLDLGDQEHLNYRTYHWAYVSGPANYDKLKREWKHAANAADGDEVDITLDNNGIWEDDQEYATIEKWNNPAIKHDPYTAIRERQDFNNNGVNDEVKAIVSAYY